MSRLTSMGKRKLWVGVLLPVLLTVGALGGAATWFLHDRISRQLEKQALQQAVLFTDAVNYAAESAGSQQALQRHVTALGGERTVKAILVVAGEPARVIASTRHAWLDSTLENLPDAELAGHFQQGLRQKGADKHFHPAADELLLVRPVLLHGEGDQAAHLQQGGILVHVDLAGMRQILSEQTRERAMLWLFTLMVIAVITYGVVSRRVLVPVESLVAAMRRRMAGEAEVRAPVTTDDEVGELATTFNHMLDAQDSAAEALRCAHEAERAGQAQRRLSARVFDSSNESIIITDANSRIVSVNPAFTRMTGYAAEEVLGQTPRLLNSGHEDDNFYAALWQTLLQTGHWQGEVWNRRKNGDVFPQWLSIGAVHDEGGQLTHYVGVGTDISGRKDAEARIERMAYYDDLTGLPNRSLFNDRLTVALAEAARHRSEGALLFLDLDHFKTINDTLGHLVGDRLLRAVANRLKECVRAMDTVSRFGGDEFLILLPETGMEGAGEVAQKVLDCISPAFAIEENVLNVTPSIGISLFPADGADVQTLLKHADVAMYHAKDAGRACYHFFQPEMNARALERLHMGNHLQRALERGEFLLHYQPQVDMMSGRLLGAEALIRWQHPEWGLVPPNRFIPVAEESGLILPIGEWVLDEACRQVAEWRKQKLAAVPIAVNLSVRQFSQAGFVDLVRRTLQRHGVPAQMIELEVTESLLMQDAETAIAVLGQLRRLGCLLSLDDFGTGYSSLSYLKRLPLDKLKIDRSFVRDISTDADDAAIVRAVTQLGHTLDLRVIAEGVETAEQVEYLLAQNCDEAQGYYFARPEPAADFAARLRQLSAQPNKNALEKLT